MQGSALIGHKLAYCLGGNIFEKTKKQANALETRVLFTLPITTTRRAQALTASNCKTCLERGEGLLKFTRHIQGEVKDWIREMPDPFVFTFH